MLEKYIVAQLGELFKAVLIWHHSESDTYEVAQFHLDQDEYECLEQELDQVSDYEGRWEPLPNADAEYVDYEDAHHIFERFISTFSGKIALEVQ